MTYEVGVIVGSLSTQSINRKLANALALLAGEAGLRCRMISIAELPSFNRDLEQDLPSNCRTFKAEVEDVDAILIVTPEHNRSIPGVLKNALDWGSRPWGSNSFAGKPSAVVGISPGAIGTAVAQQHLRSILSYLASPELAQPEVYLQDHPGLFDASGALADDDTRDFLSDWLAAFRVHIARNTVPIPLD